jgi:hypothetical protein
MKIIDVLGDKRKIAATLGQCRLQPRKGKVRRIGCRGDQIPAAAIVECVHFVRIAGESLGRRQFSRIEPRPDAGSFSVTECAKATIGGNARAGKRNNLHACPLLCKLFLPTSESRAQIKACSHNTVSSVSASRK